MKALIAAVVVPVLTLTASSSAAPDPTPELSALLPSAWVAPFSFDACSEMAGGCVIGQHKMTTGTAFAPDQHICNAPATHSGPACGDDGDPTIDPGEVLAASPEDLARLIAEDNNVMWNAERASVQILGCDGGIVANIPAAALASL